MLDSLDDKRLIFVTGKGGVGKSTTTAALGAALAARGKLVLVVETDTYSAMAEMLGARATGIKPTEAREGVWAVNLTARECLVSTLTRFLPSERVVRAITSNRVAEAFFESAPSVSEFVLLDQIQLYVENAAEQGFDHVLVDLPASGHAVTFLSVPKTLHGMMRGLGPIAKRAAAISAGIEDPRHTAILAVCLPEEMPVNETIDLSNQLRDQLGRSLDLAVVNMVHRAPIDGTWRASFHALRKRLSQGVEPAEILAGDDADALTRMVAGNALALDWYDRDMRYLGLLETRLGADVVEVPMIYEIDDTKLVDKVAHYLESPFDPTDSDALAS